ncbi:MAG: CYTH domain-containing protein [Candidatus Gracilibacteria bacterium]
MNEIEVKILDIDGTKIRRILEVMGAKKKFSGTVVAHFFRGPNGKKIRLRKMGDTCYVTAKQKVGNDHMLHNEEYEVETSDFAAMAKILAIAGLEKYGDSIKTRESYTFDGITFDIDEYPGIPEYVEVEAQSHEKVEEGVKLLGFTMADTACITESGLREKYKVK